VQLSISYIFHSVYKKRGKSMKLECSVEELKLLFKNFEIKEKTIYIDANTTVKDLKNMTCGEFCKKRIKEICQ